MKKIYLSLLVLFSGLGLSAQETVLKMPADFGQHKKPVKASAGHKMIDATLVCLTGYVPGTTMNLTFQLSLTNEDYEYGDSLSMIFPSGFTPNSTPNDPLVAANEQQDPEAFNGISGQRISWGDNDNDYGGIEAPQMFTFVVNVTIAPGVSGDQTGTFHLSGDQYSDFGPPGDYDGSFVLSTSGAPVNLNVTNTIPLKYYSFPRQHGTLADLSALVMNDGGTLTSPTNLTFSVTPGTFTATKAIPVPLASGESAELSVFYYPSGTGDFSVVASAYPTGDSDLSDNADTTNFVISDSVYSINSFNYDLASPLSFTTSGVIGVNYLLLQQDTLTEVIAGLVAPEAGAQLRVNIHEVGDTIEDRIYQSRIFTVTSADQQNVAFAIEPPLVLPAGTYFVGVEQVDAVAMGIAFAYEFFSENTVFVQLPDGFHALEEYGPSYMFTPFIQAIFGNPDGTSSISKVTPGEVVLYPNPTTGIFRIQGEGVFQVTVTNALGAVVKDLKVSGNGEISISDLPAGTYVVKAISAGQTSIGRVTLVK